MPKQPSLPFVFDDDFDQHSFHIGSSNMQAIKHIQACLAGREKFVLIYGESGCGKSHLAKIVQSLGVSVVDDLDCLKDDIAQQEDMVHEINRIKLDGQGAIVAFGRHHPNSWAKTSQLADFMSRINGFFISAEILEPDDELLRQILLKLAADQQLPLPKAVINYWLARMPRSYAAAQGLIKLLNQITLTQQSKVSIVSAKLALNAYSH